MSQRPITIVGGGLAGLTLGIGLRQQNVPVTILEAGRYPRHRVCGEFINGRGQGVLAGLGLREALVRAGAIEAGTAAFFLGRSQSPARLVTPPALCLSRHTLDALLAQEFRALKGELLEDSRAPESVSGEGIVRASGRRSQPVESGWRWFGLKVHARHVRLAADLEMHGQPDGYVGVGKLPGGEFNVCGLFRRPVWTTAPATSWKAKLRGTPGTSLHARMAEAVFDENSFCSVAGLGLLPKKAGDQAECCIGDALTMIPPVTGNGMSMAFEAAGLAINPITAYSRGQGNWSDTQRAVAQACDAAFARRLTWARWLQWLMFTPLMRGRIGGLVLGSERLWRFLFFRTR